MAQSMKSFVCWNEDMIDLALETEALQVPDNIFLASHTPVKMYREINTSTAKTTTIAYDETQFLDDFLKPKDYMFATVLGEVGTGKTHLIRWLSSRITSNKQRKVILVPRFGTNLKKILQLILSGMEGSQFDEYHQKLNRVDTELTPESARETLLGNLAIAIGPNGPHKNKNLSEEEEYMVEALPALFHDPYFRKILLRDGGIIDDLTEHIIGAKGKIERLDTRRQFTADDLPLNVLELNKASEDARQIYSELLNDDELREMAVQWINKQINSAISQMLNLQGGDLVNLMNDVRAELAKKDIELVLLFEDFAVVQGIDFQLLEALLVRPNQAEKPLCALRIAMACTTGYYQSLRDTVQNRVELRVNLDIETGNVFTVDDMEIFVARYMNVLRYQNNSVENWYNEQLRNETVSEIPSACIENECPFIEQCHGSFGNSSKVGLYPFNRYAIQTMYRRLFKEESPKFNPRILIKDVIKRTLESYTTDIREGTFPPTSIFERFAGRTRNRLKALELRKLESLDTQNAERRGALLEFWSDSKEIINLPDAIHDAFNIPKLVAVDPIDPVDPDPRPKPNPVEGSKPDELPIQLQQLIQEIEIWKNGGQLSQTLAQNLRDFIYPAVNEYIDWDSELLLLSQLESEKIWRKANIFFARSTAITNQMVSLVLPLSDEETMDAAIAFNAILRYRHYGHWNFEDGAQYFRYFRRYIHRWSTHVLNQIQNLSRVNNQNIDVFRMSVETLAMGSLLSAQSFSTKGSENVDTLFRTIKEPKSTRSNSWRSLQETVKRSEKEIKDTLLGRIACTKGQSKSVKVIDSSRIMESLQDFLNGHLKAEIFDGTVTEFNALVRTHKTLRAQFEKAVLEEEKDKLAFLSILESTFGPELSINEGTTTLRLVIEKAKNHGTYRGSTTLKDNLEYFERSSITKIIKQLKEIASENNILKKAQMLGQLDTDTVYKSKTFIQEAVQFIDQTSVFVNKDIMYLEQDQGVQNLQSITKDIDDQFTILMQVIGSLQGGVTVDSK